MKLLKTILVIIAISVSNLSNAQKPDSILRSLTKSIERSISRGYDHTICKDFSAAVFSIIITFSSKSKVENIIFSDSRNCFSQSKLNIEKHLKKNIDGLDIDDYVLKDQFLMAIVYVLPSKRTEHSVPKIPENWGLLFNNIDFEALKGKNIKYSIPIGIYLYARIEN